MRLVNHVLIVKEIELQIVIELIRMQMDYVQVVLILHLILMVQQMLIYVIMD